MQYLLLCCFDETRWAQMPDAQKDKIMQEYDQRFRRSLDDRIKTEPAIELFPGHALLHTTFAYGAI